MGAKSSQLQIRVTPHEKAALKRLARAAGQSVSKYVLGRALPSAELELARLMAAIGDAETEGERHEALSALASSLSGLSGADLATLPAPASDWPAARANHVAALVETVATRKGVEPPKWVLGIPAMERPLFRWALVSLKPYQMRVSPAAYKRRNLFLDPASSPARAVLERDAGGGDTSPPRFSNALNPLDSRDQRLLRHLDRELGARGVSVELYRIGGAVMVQAFAARPMTAKIASMFRQSAEVEQATRAVGKAEGASESWLADLVPRALATTGRPLTHPFLELPHVRVFEPVPEYVLALKCAALGQGQTPREEDDLRYLMRFMNLTTADAALVVVERFIAERQLPTDTRRRLEALLPA